MGTADHAEAVRPRWWRAAGTTAIVLAWLSASYMLVPEFWVAPLGTTVIVGLACSTWGAAGPARVGLALGGRALIGSAVLLVITAGLAWWLVGAVAAAAGVDYHPSAPLSRAAVWALHTAGQTGNEEVVLGALLLGGITRAFPRLRPLTVSVLVAAVFAALHFAFYAARPADAYNHGYLGPIALASVFATGVLRNNLILTHGHIGHAWAVHLGWNLVFMGGHFARRGGGAYLEEPERFNLVLGHPGVAALIIAAAAFTAVRLARARRADT